MCLLEHDKKDRIYLVTFNKYTDYSNQTVARYYTVDGVEKSEYISIPESGLIIRERDFDAYRKFGEGFRTLQIVGEMYVSSPDEERK